jgi:hypothetical protein
MTTSRASMMVPTPTVSAILGTLLMSPSKKRALATTVSYASVFTRVRDCSDEPARRSRGECHANATDGAARRAWLVEGNVAVGAHAAEEELDSASGCAGGRVLQPAPRRVRRGVQARARTLDGSLVRVALGLEVLGVA